MVTLTDKCKIDFEKWYCKGFDRIASMLQLELFYSKSNIEKYTYYIEWFDSEKINIHTDINTECYIGKIYVTDLIHPDFTKKYYHNCGRKFVTNQLLSEANKIYNEKSEVLYSQVATKPCDKKSN